MPLFGVLLCQSKVLVAVGDAWLDHGTFKPFVKGSDRNPIGVARKRGGPTGAVGYTVVTRYDVGASTPGNARVIVAGQDAGRPDFLRMMRPVVGIDFAAKFLVDCPHIAV